MTNMVSYFKIIAIIILYLFLGCADSHPPPPYNTQKPWAYWWWHGSSVTKEGISENLKAYSEAGMGGLHIVPIYGVKGDDDNFIEYLSPKWMEILSYTVSEAEKLGMGIDMTTGTGWPFGGPDITYEHSAKAFELKEVDLTCTINVNEITEGIEGTNLICLSALKNDGVCENITSSIQANGEIKISDNASYKKVYALIIKPTGQKVKRAAPGGEGLVMDYFNKGAFDHYFKRFDEAFGNTRFALGKVRAFYNDSYEVYGANITVDFLERFKELRGYDLANYLPVIADTSRTEIRERIATDYCETISDLLNSEFTRNWVEKCHDLGMLTRNQAHGSTGNILDLYSEADIPETESYGASGFEIPGLREDPDLDEKSSGRPNPLIMKFASSSAHLKNRKLVSSETATWLGNHFEVALSQVKPEIDELFTAGINHIFYHGITYNPPERPFPGRLFYASTNFGTRSHFWNELLVLNKYIEQCQTYLQNTKPFNDVLVYFPIHDLWAGNEIGKLLYLGVHNTREWFMGTNFGNVVEQLWNKGFTFDYISDRLLTEARVKNHLIQFEGGVVYKTIVIPKCRYIPERTMKTLLLLAEKGANIIFCETLPESVPGFGQLEQRQEKLASLKGQIAPIVSITKDVPSELLKIGVLNEGLAESGLRFIRKKGEGGAVYFVSNLSGKFHKGNVRLTTEAKQVEIFDPLTGERGLASSRNVGNGTEILLNLEPGQSCFLFCHDEVSETGEWPYYGAHGNEPLIIETTWDVTPVSGGPALPKPVKTDKLISWVQFGGDWETFSGKAVYSAEFELDSNYFGVPVRIDLGDVRETAKVTVNGNEIGLLWCIPYTAIIPSNTLEKNNRIEVEVTNLSLNRVIALDRKGVQWKGYYNTRFMDITGNPYDASDKEPAESGLLDNIKLIPLKSEK